MRRIFVLTWLIVFSLSGCASATETPLLPTATQMASDTPAPTVTPTNTASPLPPTPTQTLTRTPTRTRTPTQTATPTLTETPTPDFSATPDRSQCTISGSPTTRNVRLTLVNQSGYIVIIRLINCNPSIDNFYYLAVPVGTIEQEAVKTFTLPSGVYVRTTWQCNGMVSSDQLILAGNMRLTFSSCGETTTASPTLAAGAATATP